MFQKPILNTILLVSLSLLSLAKAFARNNDTMRLNSISRAVDPSIPIDNKDLLRAFPNLDKYFQDGNILKGNQLNVANAAPEFTKDYITTNYPVPAAIADDRDKAQQVIEEIERKGNFTDFLTTNKLIELPIGIKKSLGNTSFTLGISNAKFSKDYVTLTVFCRVVLPQGKTLFFGSDNINLSFQGGLIGTPRLVLLGDVPISINGGNTMIVLKGGFNMQTGDIANATYVTFECGGVKSLTVAADVMFPRNLLTPLNSDYTVVTDPNARVKGSFKDITVFDWNDLFVDNFTMQPFAIKGFEKVAFNIQGASFDFSDMRSPSANKFPVAYGNLSADNPNLWRGVTIDNAEIILPKEFKKRGDVNRVKIIGQKVVIDNWGFTGLVSVTNVFQDGTASGWDFSVDKFEMDVQANTLRGAGFYGSIALPVSKPQYEGDAVNKYGLAYQAVFMQGNGYLLKVITKDNISFDMWRARMTLDAGSYIELAVKDDKFRPKAFLNGSLNVNIADDNSDKSKAQLVVAMVYPR